MKHLYILFAALGIGSGIIGNDDKQVCMKPSEEMLSIFRDVGLDKFDKKTKFIQRFAGSVCDVDGLNLAIKNSVDRYNRATKTIITREKVKAVIFNLCVAQ